MHENIIDRIQESLRRETVTRWAGMQLREIQNDIIQTHSDAKRSQPRQISHYSRLPTHMQTPFKLDIEEKRIPRRTELEYTVRRDWLRELELIELHDGGSCLTPAGQKLKECVDGRPNMKIDFFTGEIGQLLAGLVDDAHYKTATEAINVLEDLFLKLSRRPLRILQTLILVNTAIFSSVPTFYGERQAILEALRGAIQRGETRLTLQSAQRVRYYYVKAR